MFLKTILGNNFFKRIRDKHKDTDFFYIDTPVAARGFFRYHLTGLDDTKIITDMENDLIRYLGFHYYLLIGQDWEEICLVYEYTGEKFLIMDTQKKDNHFFPILREETLTDFLIHKGFFTDERKDEYIQIRPIKIDENRKRVKGLLEKKN